MRRSIVFISIILFFLVNINLLSSDDLRVYRGNFSYGDFYKDPLEKLIVVFLDGDWFLFTTLNENTVDMNAWRCINILKLNGRDISEAIIVIHNHPIGFPRFTAGDKLFYHVISDYGFKGKFLLYHQPTKEIYDYVE